jgi:hypothetical protein
MQFMFHELMLSPQLLKKTNDSSRQKNQYRLNPKINPQENTTAYVDADMNTDFLDSFNPNESKSTAPITITTDSGTVPVLEPLQLSYSAPDTFLIGCQLFWKGQIQRARSYFKEASENHDYPVAHLFMSIIDETGATFTLYCKKAQKQEMWFLEQAKTQDADALYHLGLFQNIIKKEDKAAYASLLQAAEQHHPAAQNELGCFYQMGIGIPQNYQQALHWQRLAANQGFANAQRNVGYHYQTGPRVDRDEAKAALWYSRAANKGHPDAQRRLGDCFAFGLGVDPDPLQAVICYHQAANNNDTIAKKSLEKLLAGHPQLRLIPGVSTRIQRAQKDPKTIEFSRETKAIPPKPATVTLDSEDLQKFQKGYQYYLNEHYSESTPYLLQAATKNYPLAFLLLAIVTQFEPNIEHELSEIQFWPRKALENQSWFIEQATHNNPTAHYHLGLFYDLYARLQTNPKVFKNAFIYFEAAASRNHREAARYLGNYYYHGHGIDQNYTTAALWFRHAALKGDATAQHHLGCCYMHAQGVEKNDEQAIIWLTKAAKQGNLSAQYKLYYFYYWGELLKKDQAQAMYWFTRATYQGHPDPEYWVIRVSKQYPCLQSLLNAKPSDRQDNEGGLFEKNTNSFWSAPPEHDHNSQALQQQSSTIVPEI